MKATKIYLYAGLCVVFLVGWIFFFNATLIGESSHQKTTPKNSDQAASPDVTLVPEDPWSAQDQAWDGRPSDLTSWVDFWRPNMTVPGYHLLLQWRVPVLSDMAGSIVHAWPDVRMKSRVRLLPNGDIVGICATGSICRYDWNGRLIWKFPSEESSGFPHHDLIALKNGNILAIWKHGDQSLGAYGTLLEIGRDGTVVWEWSIDPYLGRFSKGRPILSNDPAHFNSVEELPPNPWYEAGDQRFRPGNILISARHLSTILIVDRRSGKIVWHYSAELDGQHEARMIPAGRLGAGQITVFDNGYFTSKLRNGKRKSRVLRIHPVEASVTWFYESEYFFADRSGAAQVLLNGNVLIASTRRLFEVTPEGETVWQLVSPHRILRPVRYPYDYCRRFDSLPRAGIREIRSAYREGFVDYHLYSLMLDYFHGRKRELTVDGGEEKVTVLKASHFCDTMVIPQGFSLDIGYGVLASPPQKKSSPVPHEFRVEMTTIGAENTTLFEDVILPLASGAQWKREIIDLARFAYQRVDLCLSIDDPASKRSKADSGAYWLVPTFESDQGGPFPNDFPQVQISVKEQEANLEHLRALGYVE